jgi:hypothetical protein
MHKVKLAIMSGELPSASKGLTISPFPHALGCTVEGCEGSCAILDRRFHLNITHFPEELYPVQYVGFCDLPYVLLRQNLCNLII